jgi:hypothetical protein
VLASSLRLDDGIALKKSGLKYAHVKKARPAFPSLKSDKEQANSIFADAEENRAVLAAEELK